MIERMNATITTKMMFGSVGIKGIGTQIFFPWRRVKSDWGIIRCKKPFLRQIEQLQSMAFCWVTIALNLMAPQ